MYIYNRHKARLHQLEKGIYFSPYEKFTLYKEFPIGCNTFTNRKAIVI